MDFGAIYDIMASHLFVFPVWHVDHFVGKAMSESCKEVSTLSPKNETTVVSEILDCAFLCVAFDSNLIFNNLWTNEDGMTMEKQQKQLSQFVVKS